MKKITAILMLIMGISLHAQNCTYDFNVSTGTYQNLTNSTSLNNGMFWDDPNYTIPIGFDFEICGNTYNTIYITDWGYGGSLFSEPNPAGSVSLIIPISQDLIDLSHNAGPSLSPISYKTTGTAGNRILKIEWKNAGFWGCPDYMNFQVWLYENNNSIAYHYGPSSVNNPACSFEGETGPITMFWPLFNWDTGSFIKPGYAITGNPSSPTLVVLDPNNPPPAGSSSALNGMIPDGTIYTFTPDNLSIKTNEAIAFSIYPNPVADMLTFKTKSSFGNYRIEILSLTGQKVKTFSQTQNHQINISDLASGIYFVKVISKGISGVQKIIKQ
ncbi:MAG TPA: T9SS type A sorting domain-containing protein [Flavobacteriaceae bacterium]|nr:T9SS type A sorting domain-containing protein [Flavobacteriaceae bacterium]